MSIKIRWLGYGCFEITLPSGKVLVTDPLIDLGWTSPIKVEEVTGADYIAVDHDTWSGHADLGKLVQMFNSKVICHRDLAGPLSKYYNLDPGNVIGATAGDTIVFNDLKVEVKRAEPVSQLQTYRIHYRVSTGKEASPSMPLKELRAVEPKRLSKTPAQAEMEEKMKAAGIALGLSEHVNFVFETSDNLRIYFYTAGTYEFLRHEIVQAHPNVFIADLGTNDPEQLAEFAALSGAEVVIPAFHDVRGAEREHKLTGLMAKHLAAKSKAYLATGTVRGKWYEIGVKLT